MHTLVLNTAEQGAYSGPFSTVMNEHARQAGGQRMADAYTDTNTCDCAHTHGETQIHNCERQNRLCETKKIVRDKKKGTNRKKVITKIECCGAKFSHQNVLGALDSA